MTNKEDIKTFYKKADDESWANYLIYPNEEKTAKPASCVSYEPKEGCSLYAIIGYVDGPCLKDTSICGTIPTEQLLFMDQFDWHQRDQCFWCRRADGSAIGTNDCHIRPSYEVEFTADELWIPEIKQRAIDLGYDVRDSTQAAIGWGFYGSTKDAALDDIQAFWNETGLLTGGRRYEHGSGYIYALTYIYAHSMVGITEEIMAWCDAEACKYYQYPSTDIERVPGDTVDATLIINNCTGVEGNFYWRVVKDGAECGTAFINEQLSAGAISGSALCSFVMPTSPVTLRFEAGHSCGADWISDYTDTIVITPTVPDECTLSTDKTTYKIGETINAIYTNAPYESAIHILKYPAGTAGSTGTVTGTGTFTHELGEYDPIGTWEIGLFKIGVCEKLKYITVEAAEPTTCTPTGYASPAQIERSSGKSEVPEEAAEGETVTAKIVVDNTTLGYDDYTNYRVKFDTNGAIDYSEVVNARGLLDEKTVYHDFEMPSSDVTLKVAIERCSITGEWEDAGPDSKYTYEIELDVSELFTLEYTIDDNKVYFTGIDGIDDPGKLLRLYRVGIITHEWLTEFTTSADYKFATNIPLPAGEESYYVCRCWGPAGICMAQIEPWCRDPVKTNTVKVLEEKKPSIFDDLYDMIASLLGIDIEQAKLIVQGGAALLAILMIMSIIK